MNSAFFRRSCTWRGCAIPAEGSKAAIKYSSEIVYNNFPWPNVAAKQRQRVQKRRWRFLRHGGRICRDGTATLADLYDPLAMPPALSKAHAELDRAVEQGYRTAPFRSDRERVEFLFSRYEKLTARCCPPRQSRAGGVDNLTGRNEL